MSVCSLTFFPCDLYAMISMMSGFPARSLQFVSIAHLQDYVDGSGESGYLPPEAFHPTSILLCRQRPPTMQATSLQPLRGVVTIRGSVDVECQCAAWCPGRVLVGLMFFSLELSMGRMAPQSHTRSWSATSAHVQGRLKGKIKHLMSELNSQLQKLCLYTYHLTSADSPHLLSSE